MTDRDECSWPADIAELAEANRRRQQEDATLARLMAESDFDAFLGFAKLGRGIVARLRRCQPAPSGSPNPDGLLVTEWHCPRAALEARIRDLEAAGRDASLERSVLAQWPGTGGDDVGA